LILAASGLVSPPVALVGGIIYGFLSFTRSTSRQNSYPSFFCRHPWWASDLAWICSRFFKPAALDSSIPLPASALRCYLGWALGRLLKVKRRISFLISAGTAICGGSAIAAIAPITNANEEEIAVSLGTVFVLNSVALLAFPAIGTFLHLTQTQFGLWAALAIHDTSSVVGATAKYGAVALAVGTTVKLARALWIVPLSVGTAMANKSKARIHWPWFILFFCLAAVANTYVHMFQPFYPALKHLGVVGLTVTLFLIGTGLSKKTLQEVGVRPLLQGIILWIVVAAGSLALICGGWIHL
jgi:uncharacterized integral membrane protein (TIGR00698 family)